MMPHLKRACVVIALFFGFSLIAVACQPSAVTPEAVTEFMEVAWDHTPTEENAEVIADAVKEELERREAEAEQLKRFYEAAAAYDAEQARLAAEAASRLPAGTTASGWAALRNCESGGRYTITNSTGKYMGAYQFDQSTWNNNAPSGYVGVRPHHAPSHIQDRAAYTLYERRGASPWPHCGRYL